MRVNFCLFVSSRDFAGSALPFDDPKERHGPTLTEWVLIGRNLRLQHHETLTQSECVSNDLVNNRDDADSFEGRVSTSWLKFDEKGPCVKNKRTRAWGREKVTASYAPRRCFNWTFASVSNGPRENLVNVEICLNHLIYRIIDWINLTLGTILIIDFGDGLHS